MKISCGIIIKLQNTVLLCHPTKASQNNSFSFPKGGVEKKDETFKDTAIRECLEEVGIEITKNLLSKRFTIDYTKNNTSKIIKRVHLFLAEINSLEQLNLTSIVIPNSQLQLSEVDWAGFLTKEQAAPKIFWRFKHLLEEIL